jgi:hypothetical protein
MMDGRPFKDTDGDDKKMDDIRKTLKGRRWDFGRNLEPLWLNEDGLVE